MCTISQKCFLQAAPTKPEAKRLTAKCSEVPAEGPSGENAAQEARRSPSRGPGGQRRAGHPRPGSGERSPGAHLHKLVLVEAERVWPLGQVHPTFLHPAGRRLSAPRLERGGKVGGCSPWRCGRSHGQFPRHRTHRFRQHGSARTAANERGRRGLASVCCRQERRADRRRWAGRWCCPRASEGGTTASRSFLRGQPTRWLGRVSPGGDRRRVRGAPSPPHHFHWKIGLLGSSSVFSPRLFRGKHSRGGMLALCRSSRVGHIIPSFLQSQCVAPAAAWAPRRLWEPGLSP